MASMYSERRTWVERIKANIATQTMSWLHPALGRSDSAASDGSGLNSGSDNDESDVEKKGERYERLDLVEKRLRLHRGEPLRAPVDLNEGTKKISMKHALPIAVREALITQEAQTNSGLRQKNNDEALEGNDDQIEEAIIVDEDSDGQQAPLSSLSSSSSSFSSASPLFVPSMESPDDTHFSACPEICADVKRVEEI